MTDETLKALARNGGVVGINFGAGFLNQQDAKGLLSTITGMSADIPEMTGKALDDYSAQDFAKNDWSSPRPAAATLADVVAHIDHVVKVAGIDHVGIGSDFDGIPDVPKGLEDASKMPALVAALLKHGYSEADVRKIMGGNTLRVMRAVIGQ